MAAAPDRVFMEDPALLGSSTLEATRQAYRILGDDLCPNCPRRARAEPV